MLGRQGSGMRRRTADDGEGNEPLGGMAPNRRGSLGQAKRDRTQRPCQPTWPGWTMRPKGRATSRYYPISEFRGVHWTIGWMGPLQTRGMC